MRDIANQILNDFDVCICAGINSLYYVYYYNNDLYELFEHSNCVRKCIFKSFDYFRIRKLNILTTQETHNQHIFKKLIAESIRLSAIKKNIKATTKSLPYGCICISKSGHLFKYLGYGTVYHIPSKNDMIWKFSKEKLIASAVNKRTGYIYSDFYTIGYDFNQQCIINDALSLNDLLMNSNQDIISVICNKATVLKSIKPYIDLYPSKLSLIPKKFFIWQTSRSTNVFDIER